MQNTQHLKYVQNIIQPLIRSFNIKSGILQCVYTLLTWSQDDRTANQSNYRVTANKVTKPSILDLKNLIN